MFVTPGIVVDGELVTTDLVDINLGIRILLGTLVLRRLGAGRGLRQARPARQPGRPAPPLEPDDDARSRRSATSTGSTRGSCRRAGSTSGPARTSRSTRAAGRSRASGRRRSRASWTSATSRPPGSSVKIHLPKTALAARGRARVEDPEVDEHARAQPRAHLLPGLRGGGRALLRREGARRASTPGSTKTWTAVQGPRRGDRLRVPRGRARRALAPHRHPQGQDRELPPVPADALEREPARHVRHARPLRGRGPEHADLRGERAREVQGDRHHAHRAQLRSVPAVRRAHVSSATARTLEVRHSPTWGSVNIPGGSVNVPGASSTRPDAGSSGAAT